MEGKKLTGGQISVFKHWTRRKEAILISLNRVIKIGVLAFSLSIIIRPAFVYAQEADSLTRIKNIEFDELEIVADGTTEVFSQMARTITIVSSAEISSSPASSLQDLLEYVAGIDIRQRNTHGVQADIQIRGGSFDQVLILLNGINITDPQTGHFNLNIPIELSSIERIEILHGSAARIYGANAYKGVINIISNKERTGLSAGMERGEFSLFHSFVNLGLSLKKQHHNLSLSANQSDGYTDNTDFKIRNMYYQGGFRNSKLEMNWQGGINMKFFGANDFYSPAFPDQYEETATGFGSLSFKTNTKLKTKGSVYYRRHNDHFLLDRSNPSFYENFHRTDIMGLKLQTGFQTKLGFTYLGMESRHEGILSNILGEDREIPVAVNRRNTNYYSKGYARNNSGVFIEQRIQHKKLYVSGGFLININQEYQNKWSFFPGLDFSYRFPKLNLKLFSSVSRSLRLPTFTDMFYRDPVNVGNPNLQPEELQSIESGIKYLKGNFYSTISVFYDEGRNVIDWVMFEGSTVYEANNIANVSSKGAELSVNYSKKPNEKTDLSLSRAGLSYVFTNQALTPGNWETKYAGDFLRQKLIATTRVKVRKSFYIDYNLSFQSRNGSFPDYNEDTGLRFTTAFEPYWLSDLKISFKQKNFLIYLKASNLFDVSYNDVGNLRQPGRWVSGGLEVNLY